MNPKTKLAINGFGRIGRNVLRALVESGRTDLEIVAINDLAPLEMQSHLFRYDSVHGRFSGDVETGENWIRVNGNKIRCTSISDPAELPWRDVDIALECTGLFTCRDEAARHFGNGSRRVLISAPARNVDQTIVYGVNHQVLSSGDRIVSNASCTTNCLAPVAKVLNSMFEIEKGYMTTIHSYTGDQPVLDTNHKDPYRARGAAISMIPTSTGAATTVGEVLPGLAGKLDGSAIRVPTPNVSVVDFHACVSRNTSVDEVNELFSSYAVGPMKTVLGVSDEPLTSIDFNHDPRSSIVALDQTRVQGGNLVRVLCWYDNEWGFSNRMLDSAAWMQQVHVQDSKKAA